MRRKALVRFEGGSSSRGIKKRTRLGVLPDSLLGSGRRRLAWGNAPKGASRSRTRERLRGPLPVRAGIKIPGGNARGQM